MSDETDREALAEKIRSDYRSTNRRRKLATAGGVTVAIIAAIAALAWIRLDFDSDDSEIREPAHASADYGFTLTPEVVSGSDAAGETIPVAIYEDFLCGSCRIFHETTSEYLIGQVEAGVITLTYHPFTFLLTQSTDEYSQRAANAAVCVADEAGPLAYAKMHGLLMAEQPELGGPGLSDERLIELAHDADAEDPATCIEEREFSDWVAAATEAGLAADVTETPTVRVNGINVVRSADGKEVMPGPEELEFAIESFSN